MKIIGTLDSPFVRRTLVSFETLGIEFEHQWLSVLTNVDEFKKVNPVVKAPTLVCSDGEILMDSNMIIQYGEQVLAKRSLMPEASKYRTALQSIALALTANEKTVQIVYETRIRPEEKRHDPWLDRVKQQLACAYDGLHKIYSARAEDHIPTFTQDDITVATAWRFTQFIANDVILAEKYPALVKLSEFMEATEIFKKYSGQ